LSFILVVVCLVFVFVLSLIILKNTHHEKSTHNTPKTNNENNTRTTTILPTIKRPKRIVIMPNFSNSSAPKQHPISTPA